MFGLFTSHLEKSFHANSTLSSNSWTKYNFLSLKPGHPREHVELSRVIITIDARIESTNMLFFLLAHLSQIVLIYIENPYDRNWKMHVKVWKNIFISWPE
ncbi:hypothetical protein BpHYR1_039214 [Brachionus plicatilis]|uniref:Uncharacterized protein n=1 Tax=Brachionus plicatilis TaxID=10195 RepID=A0A3M7QWU7_BRAPC|nr:hypothetical protein BpHYR1_039214 [Brachionus plicatilis]